MHKNFIITPQKMQVKYFLLNVPQPKSTAYTLKHTDIFFFLRVKARR